MLRDRHGRGLRGPLMPSVLPARKTSRQYFDELAMAVVTRIEHQVSASLNTEVSSLRHIEFAVADIPPEVTPFDADIVEDAGVPLARLFPAQPGTVAAAPRIVLYRRPIEMRSASLAEKELLIQSVLAEQLSGLLGISPDEMD
ncbi:metallopeptidase family protein [Haloglycomyces albus]|uniref:metallopeptidase family protein n=1 Tax=Haloglycomyces albus TaxID=526067 RepID=UPI000A074613|nr:metallopeptidase family protein [Haloglycomyces albus]